MLARSATTTNITGPTGGGPSSQVRCCPRNLFSELGQTVVLEGRGKAYLKVVGIGLPAADCGLDVIP